MKQNITLLGAGLVGSLLAILLQKRGYQVSVIERRGDMRKTTVSAGRSINLAMSVRGWAGLELADLRKEIEEIAIPMFGREIHPVEGNTIFQYYGKNKEAIYSVSRGELNKKLIELAEQNGVQFIFNKRILDVDIDTNTLTIEDTLTKEVSIDKNHELIIASDGAFSALRNAYTKKDRYNYNQFYIEHGYKELHIPAGPNSSFLMEKNALHIWPRKKLYAYCTSKYRWLIYLYAFLSFRRQSILYFFKNQRGNYRFLYYSISGCHCIDANIHRRLFTKSYFILSYC